MNELIPINEIQSAATFMAKSKLFGKSMEELASLMLIAHAEGKPIATAAMEYDVIQGKPALKSQAAQGRFQAAGGKITWLHSDDKVCEAEFTHPAGGTIKIRWDMARAGLAGLCGKNTWKQYPAHMLRARCVAEGVRACYPACLSQMYLVEEVRDFDEPAKRKTIHVDAEVETAKPEPQTEQTVVTDKPQTLSEYIRATLEAISDPTEFNGAAKEIESRADYKKNKKAADALIDEIWKRKSAEAGGESDLLAGVETQR